MNEGTINAEVTMGGAMGVLLVNRYRVLKQLGQGGMGSVWLAEDTKLDGRKVAVKMLPSILVSNKRAYAQVKQEALVSLKLTHPNIVAVRAFEEEGGNPFLVMDYIEGQTLDDHLAEKGKLTEEETIRLLKPIAAALDYAHAQGVVHRDVKPGNIMIRKDGTPFVLDFGIAREIQETMTCVTGKLSSGTLLYMSPEQLNGDAPKSAQDIYSFAAVAYECLKGELPFSRGGVEDQIKHKLPEPLGPQFIKCGLGVMAGLAKSPEARPATCVAVLSDRSRIPCDHADHGTFVGRSWIVSVLMGVLVLAVLAGIGGWWLWKAQEDVEAVQRAEIARQQEGFRHLKEERRIADERCVAAKKRIAEGGKAADETPVVDEGRTTKAKRMQSVEENCIAKETESERVVEEGRSACFRTVIDTCEVHGIVAISGKRYNSPVKCEKLRKGTAIGKICAAYERGRGLSATCCRQMRKGGKIYFEGRMEQRTVDWAGEKCIDVALTPYVLPFYTKGTDCVEGRTRVMFSLLGGEDFEVVCGEAI